MLLTAICFRETYPSNPRPETINLFFINKLTEKNASCTSQRSGFLASAAPEKTTDSCNASL
jgi:hypothetical protein